MKSWLVAAGSLALFGLAAVALLPMMLLSAIYGGDGSEATLTSASGSVTSCSVSDDGATVAELDQDQLHNAAVIIGVGKADGVPSRGWVIAIATALQESGMRNLHYGDRDSQGLFQQRPSAGWGTVTQVTTPSYAADAFYKALLRVAGWGSMPLWQAAQTVQRSAFPFAYAGHEALATRVVDALAGITAACPSLQAGPWMLPVATTYVLTSGFGPRTSPTTGAADFHTGQDFAVPVGTPARAASAGVVEFTGWDGGYGNLVKIRHANGVETYYGHLSRIESHVGEQVQPGEVIALTGSTGNSTGPHLHFEVRVDGQPTDPMPWLSSKGLEP